MIIFGFMLSLQTWFSPRGVSNLIDNTNEVEETISQQNNDYWSRLIKSDENPGWLWDPVEKEWVDDPNLPRGEQ
jgi:hypothetical protein